MREIICKSPELGNLTFDNLCDKLSNEHFIIAVIKLLRKNADDNIVIWGTYNNAIRLRDFLVNEGVKNIKACVINEAYYQNGVNETMVREDFPQYAIEEWLDKHDKTTIVVDFSFYSVNLLEPYKEKVADVYVGDLMGVFILEEPYVISKSQIEKDFDDLRYTYDRLEDAQSKKEFLEYLLQKNVGFYAKPYHKGPQYFDSELFGFSNDGVLVDCGAYVGDTIEDFIVFCHDMFSHVYSFEMDLNNYKKLIARFGSDDRITCINKGVGQRTTEVKALLGMNSASRVSENGSEIVHVVAIDDELYDKHVSIIKMDIEGFEMETLLGAEKTIRKYKPVLAVCMYHKYSDLTKIPQIISSFWPGYKFFFRNYHNSASECVLYAIP